MKEYNSIYICIGIIHFHLKSHFQLSTGVKDYIGTLYLPVKILIGICKAVAGINHIENKTPTYQRKAPLREKSISEFGYHETRLSGKIKKWGKETEWKVCIVGFVLKVLIEHLTEVTGCLDGFAQIPE